MKTSQAAIGLFVVLCMSMLLCGCYGYHPLIPARDIPPGAVIQESDILGRTGRCWTLLLPDDYAEDRARVIGHKVLKPLRSGGDIHESDIGPIVETAK